MGYLDCGGSPFRARRLCRATVKINSSRTLSHHWNRFFKMSRAAPAYSSSASRNLDYEHLARLFGEIGLRRTGVPARHDRVETVPNNFQIAVTKTQSRHAYIG